VAHYDTIVVGVDFSDNSRTALQAAARLADDLGARIRAVHVVSQSALRVAIQEGLFEADDDDHVVQAKVRAWVDAQFDEFFAGAGVSPDRAEKAVLRGDPARELVDDVRENGGDLIVVGRRGKTLADVLLGSVAERALRLSPCPVMIVRQS
jgi:nucleotide-binding universal stress UspA family protein